MNYLPLKKPVYWIGFDKGKITKRKFIEFQEYFPSYYRDTEDNVRYVNPKIEFNKILTRGRYSMYSYSPIDEKLFLDEMLILQQKRVRDFKRRVQKQIDDEENIIIQIQKLIDNGGEKECQQ